MLQDIPQSVRAAYTIAPVPRDLIPSTSTKKAQILWVGCSDSWITETQTLDVMAEETFVHRNLGNVLSNGDLSSESAIQYAVELLKVKHIVVCGHYDCGLVKAAKEDPDAMHGWYADLSKLRKANESFLSQLPASKRDRHLVEIYVLAEANWLKTQPTVAKAIKERGLKIHPFVFDKEEEKTVQLVEQENEEEDEKKEEVSKGELGGAENWAEVRSEMDVEIRAPWRKGVDANGLSRQSRSEGGEKNCTGSCGGLGLCKKAKENEQQYAF